MGWIFPVLLTVLCAQLSAAVPDGADIQVIDVLSLQDSKQSVAAVEKLSGSLSALSDIYVVSTFRLPVKMGGVLFGLYSKQDNRKYLEVAVMGKISKVLVRYVKADGKVHTVNLQNSNLADGRTHSIIVRLGGLQRSNMHVELYADCRLADSSQGVPPLVPLPREAEMVEIRHGQKSYARLQGTVESLRLALGGSVAKAGALTDCPFQGDSSAYNSVNGDVQSILGEHTKALIGQLIIFNQVLGELRQDIREQVKEMSLIRNTILECQVCGFHEPRSRCSPNPCYKGVSCMDSLQYPGYTCGPCPPGTTGNGTHCRDIDECELQPCYSPGGCVNTVGGFSCKLCPPGLWGAPLAGTGLDYAKTHKQECVDIDECVDLPDACASNSVCINTMGSYKCGGCKPGFFGNQTSGCFPRKSCAALTFNPCDTNAHCAMERNGQVFCRCKRGRGPGERGPHWGDGTDMTFFPDRSLPGQDNKQTRGQKFSEGHFSLRKPSPLMRLGQRRIRKDQCDEDADGEGPSKERELGEIHGEKLPFWFSQNKDQQNSDSDSFGDSCDNCPTVPNTDQKDTDNNGQGDACDQDIDGDANGVGDVCENDFDNDAVMDLIDVCPESAEVTLTISRGLFQTVIRVS
ncbi:Thrombospondin-3a [Crenichthys baileyi]|uniref:Thrombospondin-3a n=1 Tax=Crenichthys baileyi TaxID=28760 RepID=A0AAV9RYC2_9TELE